MLINICRLLLPAIIPSWRFFDTIAPSPRIEYSISADNWLSFCPSPQSLSLPHSVKRLFWNVEWNDYLFMISCAERLMQNQTKHSEQEIVNRIRKYHPSAKNIQFRLRFLTRDENHITYISDIHS